MESGHDDPLNWQGLFQAYSAGNSFRTYGDGGSGTPGPSAMCGPVNWLPWGRPSVTRWRILKSSLEAAREQGALKRATDGASDTSTYSHTGRLCRSRE